MFAWRGIWPSLDHVNLWVLSPKKLVNLVFLDIVLQEDQVLHPGTLKEQIQRWLREPVLAQSRQRCSFLFSFVYLSLYSWGKGKLCSWWHIRFFLFTVVPFFAIFMLVKLGGSSCLQVQFYEDCCISFFDYILCIKCWHERVWLYDNIILLFFKTSWKWTNHKHNKYLKIKIWKKNVN